MKHSQYSKLIEKLFKKNINNFELKKQFDIIYKKFDEAIEQNAILEKEIAELKLSNLNTPSTSTSDNLNKISQKYEESLMIIKLYEEKILDLEKNSFVKVKSKTILVISDSALIRMKLKKILSTKQITVLVAKDSQEGMDLIMTNNNKVDLVILHSENTNIIHDITKQHKSTKYFVLLNSPVISLNVKESENIVGFNQNLWVDDKLFISKINFIFGIQG